MSFENDGFVPEWVLADYNSHADQPVEPIDFTADQIVVPISHEQLLDI